MAVPFMYIFKHLISIFSTSKNTNLFFLTLSMLQLTKLVSVSLLPVACALGLQFNSFLKWLMFSIRPNVWGWLFSLCFCHGSTILLLLSLGECLVVLSRHKFKLLFFNHLNILTRSGYQICEASSNRAGNTESWNDWSKTVIISHFPLQPQMGFMFSSVMSTSKTCVSFIFFCFMVSWNNVQNTTMKVSQNL